MHSRGKIVVKEEFVFYKHIKVIHEGLFNKADHVLVEYWENVTVFFALFYFIAPDYKIVELFLKLSVKVHIQLCHKCLD